MGTAKRRWIVEINMLTAARVIILKNNKILFIHRIKYGKEYYVLPGGAIEANETPEAAAVREIKEETNFEIKIDKLLWGSEEFVKSEKRYAYYFLAKSFTGKLKLGGPEIVRQAEDNQYIFEWLTISELDKLLVYPEGLKERIKEYFS
ncbi:NUDIX domain-containing protein [Candidatus Woesearchaeota archaeon]|jgi:8-oxo-dGTP diphosphatase|nr:NUDIX domain-containing protein [Candidatus Woesearchaeota archaeon]MBT4111035.1 NUDIX domain-containing protein [Candidatus Woesearchaeota archaeon]MBT4336904.1 NUDIX domain-containing protein [Candidatus Woesearchaeota archaeon]MBT4469781.1 NUDIX domain-containing protein [Candidatus Woesearchaeota archaeon]MBT6743748.1 NUDIX domain-containing protein [Candidatus Woesearchaeota archaeon]